jgi:sulfatase modifying factor 1
VQITWEDAQEYCHWLTACSPQFDFALPSEAQWEYACRAGASGEFCFGDDTHLLCVYARTKLDSANAPFDVASLQPNQWGIFDMHGNVGEWCQDATRKDYQDALDTELAWAPPPSFLDPSPYFRIARGGSWASDWFTTRAAARSWVFHLNRYADLGFRPIAVEACRGPRSPSTTTRTVSGERTSACEIRR